MIEAEAGLEEQLNSVIDGLDFSAVAGDTVGITWSGEATDKDSIREVVAAISRGETLDADALLSSVLNQFLHEITGKGRLMLSLMLPVLLMAVLSRLICGQGNALSGMCQGACMTVVLIPMITQVIGELESTKETIVSLTGQMERMLPLLITLLTAVGGSASSAFFHPMVVMASGSMVFAAREVVLRLVICVCAVTAVNHLCGGAHLTRMARLLRSAACWLLGVSFTVFIGTMSLQGVCSASIDGIVIRAAKYAVDNFVPVVGGMFSDTMDTLIGCTLIVKNAMGVTCVLTLCGVLLRPMLHTLSSVAVMKLSAALLEPVAQERIILAIGDFSRIMVLFLITMLCVGAMYFLLIVQLLLVGNLTVLLR